MMNLLETGVITFSSDLLVNWVTTDGATLRPMMSIEPEPSEEERQAILAALAGAPEADSSWSAAALREGVEDGEEDP